METFIFIYGSLKKGYRYHDFLAGATFIAEVVTQPNYLLYDCGRFPYMIETEIGQGRCIEGELYKVSQATLIMLDQFSVGCDRRNVKLEGDYPFPVFAYIYNRSVERYLDCGTSWPRS